MSEIEVRHVSTAVEVRETAEGRIVLEGVAIRYGARSKDLGGFRERIMPGAATEAIAKGDVRAVEEHRMERYLGRTGNGTLRLVDSPSELRYSVDLPDTTVGREVAQLAKRSDFAGSSFGFVAGEQEWSKGDDGIPLRTVTAFRSLRDVGPVVSPAYETGAASVSLRSWLAAQDAEELAEELEVEAVKFFRRNVY